MEDETNEIILTSKLGRFFFDSNVRLAHAKIVRDAVTCQFFSPDNKRVMIETEEDAYTFINHHPTAEFAVIPFAVAFDEQWLRRRSRKAA